MALVKPFVFQFVGYQNSGKTTFVNTLLSQLKKFGVKTVTIKHHGHGGKPAIANEKDSTTHISSGAIASLVEGGGRLLLQIENSESSLEDKIKLISITKPDLILIEGYKREAYPKAVFIRNDEDVDLLNDLKEIELVLYRDEAPETEIVSFHREDEEAVKWMVDYFLKMI
ncbi:molybdopterin-guanine dinucleotide biosynthesis protein B [Niallia sp. XMNu-256]|uniref:molybdopterin-guanine dinucleotide biosynthesis protein B n=1 Tax=Niallia sp. XMNu-256 TaxID=3082444 RepID=UPI0030D45703